MLFNNHIPALIIGLSSILFINCSASKKGITAKKNAFTSSIEIAHKMQEFSSKKYISFDMDMTWKGTKEPRIHYTLGTKSEYLKMTYENKTWIEYNNGKYQYSPKIDSANARFDIFTYSYFFMLPYKLNDSGTKWENFPNNDLKDNKSYVANKLSFEKNIGDAPDDWYIVYKNAKTNILEAAAYIVTYGGGDPIKAAQKPHMIQYGNYTNFDEIPLATKWKFSKWSSENGVDKNPMGEATLSNIKFSSKP